MKLFNTVLFIIVSCACVTLPIVGIASDEVSFAAVAADADQRLATSLQELAEQRSKISSEKLPIAQSINRLEDQVLTERRKLDELLRKKMSRQLDLNKLQEEVDYLHTQNEFVDSLLNDFVRDFEGRLDLSETPLYESITAEAKLAPSNVNLTAAEKRSKQMAVIRTALSRIEDKLGGNIFAGEALSPNGELVSGRFLQMGPVVYFASENGQVFGLTETQSNAADPVVIALPNKTAGTLPDTLAAGSGLVPFDVTLGKAVKIFSSSKSLSQYVEDGGEVGYVIIALGIASILIALFKTIELLKFRVATPVDIDFILDKIIKSKFQDAFARAELFSGSAAAMLKVGIEHFGEKRAMLEELMFEHILTARPKLERLLPFLSITAATAPLLGLLGTVIGMIKTFQLITIFGTGDAKSLSTGISEALVTTALGLIVAIPILIIHGMLSRMAKKKLAILEQGLISFVNFSAQNRASGTRKKHEDSEPESPEGLITELA